MAKIMIGDPKGALGDLNSAINLNPEKADYFMIRGEARRRLGNWDLAIADLTRTLELRPGHIAVLLVRAECHKEAGDIQQAMMDYSQVIRLSPDDPEAHLKRGKLRFFQQRFPESAADFARAAELAPDPEEAFNWLGFARFATGEFEPAVAALERAVGLDPHGAKYPLIVRHFALVRLGRPDKRLATTWGHWGDALWPQALAQCIVGRVTPEALLKLADEPADEKDRNGRRCEAHYYIGLLQQQAGESAKALNSFKASVATGVSTFIEYTLASHELSQL